MIGPRAAGSLSKANQSLPWDCCKAPGERLSATDAEMGLMPGVAGSHFTGQGESFFAYVKPHLGKMERKTQKDIV